MPASPLSGRKGVLGTFLADMAHLGRGEEACDHDEPSSLPGLFIGKLTPEGSPTGIVPGLAVSTPLGSRQRGDSQVFNTQTVITIRQFPTALVQPVLSLMTRARL